MRRREFIAGLGSAAASPLTARAQRAATKRIGIIINNPGGPIPKCKRCLILFWEVKQTSRMDALVCATTETRSTGTVRRRERGAAADCRSLIVAVLLTAPLAAQPLSRSVLLLDQSSVGLPFNTALATAARLTLNAASKVPISFYAENLDANRFFGSDYEQEILSFFRQKYRNKTIDVVVAVGSAALDFITRRRAELWPNVPVVFAAIDEATIAKVTLPPNVTGVTMQLTLQDMMRTANIVVPDLKRIAIVGDPLERQTFYRHFLDEIPAVATQYEIIDLMNLSISELKRRLGNLPDATAVIYTGIYYDNEGVSHVPAELVTQIAEWANRPVVINVASYLGKGAVGGYIVRPEPLGQRAAQFALRILDGENASDLPVTKVPSPLIFEWPALQRWGISESSLPSGSEVLFHNPTVWE